MKKRRIGLAVLIALIIISVGCCIKKVGKIETSQPEKKQKIQEQYPLVEKMNPAKDILSHFTNENISFIRYVAVINNTERVSLLNDDKIPYLSAHSVSSSTESKKMNKIMVGDLEDEKILTTKDMISCVFEELSGTWYLPWDNFSNQFQNIEIGYRVASKTELKNDVSSFLKRCNDIVTSDITASGSINLKLNQKLNDFFERNKIRDLDNAIKQQIIFFSEIENDGIYLIFYLQDNGYGRLIPREKIFITDESASFLCNRKELIKILVSMFDVKPDNRLLIMGVDNNNVSTILKHESGHGVELSGDNKKQIISLLSDNIINKISGL